MISSDSERARTYYHYASDELGSIIHVVNGNTPRIENVYEYDSFGNTVYAEENIHNPFRYTGQQYDSLTGLYYLRARFYNPATARFTQEDSYYGDGLNLYAYCNNNPVNYYDPEGHEKLCPKGYVKKLTKEQWKRLKIQKGSSVKKSYFNNTKIRAYKGIDPKKLNAQYDIVTSKRTFKNMKIRLSDSLVIEMPYIGKGKSNANAAGYLRDSNYYFEELYKLHPEYFSPANVNRLKNGYAITNDSTFRKYFPEYDVKGLRGKTLYHHHVGGGAQAVAIPSPIHPGSGGIHNIEKMLGIWGNGI